MLQSRDQKCFQIAKITLKTETNIVKGKSRENLKNL